MDLMYIFAYPGQAITIQVYESQYDALVPVDNVNCMYSDVVRMIDTFNKKYFPRKYYITGNPDFYIHLKNQIEQTLNIELEEVDND